MTVEFVRDIPRMGQICRPRPLFPSKDPQTPVRYGEIHVGFEPLYLLACDLAER